MNKIDKVCRGDKSNMQRHKIRLKDLSKYKEMIKEGREQSGDF